ncbi:heat shock 70kDa protein 1/2/6/8 [Purpureocillium lavendulum]|uniref:Heat shock 70kDa protein 1/2/6/8 n=1 Tax=Purpureocillium lavendulum TaxID=1247861 RepID=A0AB34FHA9_9HYPO|nr:heat shock 70kDa protein 1/2/6/8 [Purpureocillium lavendulum]
MRLEHSTAYPTTRSTIPRLKMPPARWAVGIDLGTANTRVAVYRPGQPIAEIIPTEDGSSYFPSYVSISEAGRVIGAQAKGRASANLQGTTCHAKAFLGTRFCTPNMPQYSDILPFNVTDGAGGAIATVRYRDSQSRPAKTVELLSMLLGYAKRQAEAYLGGAVNEVCIAVPALFNHEQRREIIDAAEIAGLKVMNLTAEPCGLIFAAMAALQLPKTEVNVLALDIGASFCNVALATVEEGIVEIKAMGSDMVGGNDLDSRLVHYLARAARDKGMHPIRSKRATHRLRMASEAAKIALSSSEKHTVALESLVDDRDLFEEITRETFESLCTDLFRATTALVDTVMAQSRNQKFGISYVFIGGETSRVPKLQELWKRKFDQSIFKYANTGDAGAIGLAMHAGVIAGLNRNLLLLEVTQQSIGVETLGGVMSKIVPRYTTIPTQMREKFSWTVKNDGFELQIVPTNTENHAAQSRPAQAVPSYGALHIYEGQRVRTKDNRRIGTIDLAPLFERATSANFDLEVQIDIDARYAISVHVSIPGTKARISKNLDTAGRLNDAEMRTLQTYANEFELGDAAEASRVAARCNLDRQLALCQERLDVISADIDPSFPDTVRRIRDWTEDNPDARQKDFMDKLQDIEDIEAQIGLVWRAKMARETEGRSPDAPGGSSLPDIGNLALGRRAPQPVRPKSPIGSSDKTAETRTEERQRSVTTEAYDADATVKPLPISKKQQEPGGKESTSTKAQKEDVTGSTKTARASIEPVAPEVVVVGGPEPPTPRPGKGVPKVGDTPAKHETLTVDSGVGGLDETLKRQPSPQPAEESEVESSLLGTVEQSGTEITVVGVSGLDAFFSSTSVVSAFTDTDFHRMSTYLRNTGNAAWSTAPRLYTVLRAIDQVDAMEVFLRQGINDMWFPFTPSTLPAALQPSIQARFLDHQKVAYSQSKSYQLESGEQKHVYFSKDDPLPFKVIARLGRGAHGSVDKVMSNFSQREYARKLFRKSRGLRAEDVQTFKTELAILKKLTHRHCVSLVATYSDPKYFALLMEPVGDHNLSEYYARCKNEPDKRSLMRSFFGCLVGAVQYLHDSQVRHRDIKPQNIIVRSDQVYVADFGIAHSWENLTRATTTADSGKTLIYAAPEVVRVERRNTAADLWSLGCVFLEMATVLKGKTVQELRAHFIEHSDTPAFHANAESMQSWAQELRQLAPAGDNMAIDWALRMLQQDQHARPTAATLFEEIVHESISCGTLFCGTCCDGMESTEGEEDDEHLLYHRTEFYFRLQAHLKFHDLLRALFYGSEPGFVEPLERPAGVAAIAVVHLDGLLGAGDGGLCEGPVAAAEDLLEGLGLVLLALRPEIPDAGADLGHDVCAACDDAAAAADEGLEGEVADAAKGHVAGALVEGGLGVEGGGDAGELAGAAAGELCAADVGVGGEADEQVAVEVDTGDGAGVVVDDDGDGAGVGNGSEVVDDGVLVDLGAVVRGGQDEDGVGGAVGRVGGEAAQLDGAADAALGGAEEDGRGGEAGVVEGLAGGAQDGELLVARAVDGLSVGAHDDEPREAGAGEALGVRLDGGDVEVLGGGVEEGHGRGVDAAGQGAGAR